MKDLALTFDGDTSVTNSGRVLRLAGSIAWPQKPGRVMELTQQAPLKAPGKGLYKAEDVYSAFPPVLGPRPASGAAAAPGARAGTLGLGRLKDGRERYMRNTIFACLIEYVGTNGCDPSPQELFDIAWPQYERNVDLSRPGRGPEEFAQKCTYIVDRFLSGELEGARSIDEAVSVWLRKQAGRESQQQRSEPWKADQPPPKQDTKIRCVDFLTLMTEDVPDEPDYIEPGFAGPGTFGLIAGPPKAQKSWLMQEALVACATGKSFLCGTFTVPRPLRVFYLQAEMNRKLLRKRARELLFLSESDKALLAKNLIVSERFHMLLNDDGVKLAVATIKEHFPNEPPDIIGMDPMANLFDGENENDNTQIMRFLASRIEAVRQQINPLAAILMVHHATKKGVDELARDPFVAIRGGGALRGYYDSAIVIYRKNEESSHRKVHFELRSGESPDPIEVELDGGRFHKAGVLTEINKDIARRMLEDTRSAWLARMPLSPHSRADKEGRYIGRLARQYSVSIDAVVALFRAWADNGVVVFRERERRGRPAGFEVMGDIL